MTVDIRWDNSKAIAANLRPEFAGKYRMRAPAGQQIHGIANLEFHAQPDGSVEVALEANRSYGVCFA